jgi:hypothetical protein
VLSVGASGAVPASLVVVTAIVTGGTLVVGIFVLVSSPPHPASSMAASTNTDKSMLNFLIRTNSFSNPKIDLEPSQKSATLRSTGYDRSLVVLK